MIELKRKRKTETGSEYHLFIDHKLKKSVNVEGHYDRKADGELLIIDSRDAEASREIIQHNIKEFPPVEYFHLEYKFEWTEIISSLLISNLFSSRKKNKFNLIFVSWPNLSLWTNQFNFSDYCKKLSEIINEGGKDDVKFKAYDADSSGINNFEISIPIELIEQSILDEVTKWADVIRRYHIMCVNSLSSHRGIKGFMLSPDKSQCLINGHWFHCFSTEIGKLVIGGGRSEITRIPVNLFHDVTIDDLPANSEFNLQPNRMLFEYLDWITLHHEEKTLLKIICSFNFAKWDRPWNLYPFVKDMVEIINSRCPVPAVADLETSESGSPLVEIFIESQHTGVNTVEAWINDLITFVKHAFEITETKYATENNFVFKNGIVREIEFSPEHYQAGLSILGYFGSILRQKYSDSSLKVKIIQDNMIVRMIIETPEGKREELEKTLTEYGRVISGSLTPENFLSNPIDVLQLKQQLTLARAQLENQRELLVFQNQQYSSRLTGLEEEIKWLRSHIGAVFSFSESSDKVKFEKVNHISQQIIYGDVTTYSSSGSASQINVSIGERDSKSFIKYLVKAGIPEGDASELADIVAIEEPSSTKEPLGAKAKAWLVKNIRKAADGTWNIGASVATKVLTEAVLKYYGLK